MNRCVTCDSVADPLPANPSLLHGKYQMCEVVGGGGFGTVWKAISWPEETVVAIKQMNVHAGRKWMAVVNTVFERQRRLLEQLSHVGLPRLHEAFTEAGHRYLVMDYLEGETLARRLRRAPLGIQPALRIARQVCAVLVYLHSEGVMHRDLHPANILVQLCEAGVPAWLALVDFDLATWYAEDGDHALRTDESDTVEADLCQFGTPAYAAPEQHAGRPTSPLADIYSLSILLYVLLTGQVLEEDPPSSEAFTVLESIPGLSHDLVVMLFQMRDEKPENRPPSVAVLGVLDRALQELDGSIQQTHLELVSMKS